MCRLPALCSVLIFLTLAAPTNGQASKGKKYAVLLGITDYSHSKLGTLKYTENDVEELAKILSAKSAGFTSVRVLTTTRGKKDAADAPTATNIRKVLLELLKEKTKDDTVLIALSGHGVQLDVEDPDRKGKTRTFVYFCPSNADFLNVSYKTGTNRTLLNMNGLLNSLDKCGAGTKLLLVDACRNELQAESTTRSIDPTRVTIPIGVGALFSCKSGQKAFESDKLKHGVFFHHLLEGLRGEARNKDGEVTWDRLGEYVRRAVPKYVASNFDGGARQTPHAMTNIEGEPPVLVRLGKVVGKDRPKENDLPGKGGPLSITENGVTYRAVETGGIEAMGSKDKVVWKWNADRKQYPAASGKARAIAWSDRALYVMQGDILFSLRLTDGRVNWGSKPLKLPTRSAPVELSVPSKDVVSVTTEKETIRIDARNGFEIGRK